MVAPTLQNLAPNQTLPSCSLHPNYQTAINQIKPPKPNPLTPHTAHYPTQSTLKSNNYLSTRTCDSGSSLTLVLLGSNTQLYTYNYGLNNYHPTPITFLYISPPTFFSTNTSQPTNHLKPIPLFPHKNPLPKDKKE